MERQRIREGRSELIEPVLESLDELRLLHDALEQVNLKPIFDDYRELVRQIRAEGISLSDRRAIKLLKLIAAAALLRGATQASPLDLWVLLHVWNRPEQSAALQAIVAPVIERAGGQAARAERPLDDLAIEIQRLEQRDTTRDEGRAYTATYYGALLHDLEHTRQELLDHSAAQRSDQADARWQTLLDRVETLVDTVLDHLEQQERI
jgi:MoxR-like ATPase